MISIDTSDVRAALPAAVSLMVNKRVIPIFNRNRAQAVAYAQEHAPWTDRTANARQSINAVDLSNEKELKYRIFIGVFYGVFLELSNQGKYRILGPTADKMAHQLIRDLRR